MASMELDLGKTLKHGTNILDFDVPPELDRCVQTGVSFVDSALGGGATPSCSMVLTGMPGAGKTTMMMQMADAITGQGHICLLNSNEEAVVQLRKTARRLRVKNGFVIGNDRFTHDLLEHARMLQKQVKGKKAKDGSPVQVFVIVDSLQTMNDGKYGENTNGNTPVRVTEEITQWCKTKNSGQYGIGIIIGQVTKGGEFAGKQAIAHAVDAHMHLRIDQDSKSETVGMRLLEMRKNRFGGGAMTHVLDMASYGLYEAEAVES